eukprot:m51a1_g7225 hypothetical protein (257) ;mRNA; f:16544-17443
MSRFDGAKGRWQRKRPREQDDGTADQRPLKKRETGGETSYSEQEQCDRMDTEAPTLVPRYTEIENAAAFGSVAQSADEHQRPSDVQQSLCVPRDTTTTQQATAASPEPEPEPTVDEQIRSLWAQPMRDPKPEVDDEELVARPTPHDQTLAVVKAEDDETQSTAPEAVPEEATAQGEDEEQPEGEGDTQYCGEESDQMDQDEDEDGGRIHVWVFEDDDPTSHEGDEDEDEDDNDNSSFPGWRGRVPDPFCYSAAPAA